MKIHKVTNIEQFVAKIVPKQAQKNKTIVDLENNIESLKKIHEEQINDKI